MSGRRFLLDTNAVVALLRGEGGVLDVLQDAEWVGVSIITQLEFLSFIDQRRSNGHPVILGDRVDTGREPPRRVDYLCTCQ